MRTQYPLTDIAPVRNPRRRAPRFWPRGNRPMRRSFDDLRASFRERLLPGSATADRTWTSVGEAAERVLSRTAFVPVTPGVREGWAPIAPDVTSITGVLTPLSDEVLQSIIERRIGADPESMGVRFSISTPRFFHAERLGESGFGSTRQIARDIHALGCTDVWHPGRLQLLLRNLFPTGIPRDDTGAAIRAAVKGSTVLEDLETFVRDLHSEGLQLRLTITWLTLGAGSRAVEIEDPRGVRTKPLAAGWSADHDAADAVLVADDGGTYDFWNGLGRSDPWHSRTMDPTNPYKLQYYRWMSQALGQWLTERRDALLADGIDLADYISGIEIGNELSTRHCYIDGPMEGGNEGDAGSWARFYYWCSTGIWEAADWVPLWLPAMSSYVETGMHYNIRWSGKLSFIQEMLRELENQLAENRLDYSGPPSLGEVVGGLDYHYYHHKGSQTQPLLFMQADLQSCRRMLDRYFPDGQSKPLLTMQECGFNVVCEAPDADATPGGTAYDTGCEYGATRADSVPDYASFANPLDKDKDDDGLQPSYRFAHIAHGWIGGSPGTGLLSYTGALDYQATALWCRLALAIAAGADVVGWHTLMAAPTGAFAGTGLRRDQHPSSAPGADPGDAEQRASYDAYQRLIRTLGRYTSAEVLTSGDLAPLPDDGSVNLHDQWKEATPTAAHHAFVLHFSKPRGFVVWPHLYLCFADPHGKDPYTEDSYYFIGDRGIRSALLRLSGVGGTGTFTVQTQSARPTGMTPTGGEGLPGAAWSSSPMATVRISASSPLELVLTRSGFPVLVRSPHELRIDHLVAIS